MRHNFLVGTLLMAAITLMLAGCAMDDNGGGIKPPEQQTAQERWDTWVDDVSTATVAISVDNDDVCAITVGGTASGERWHVSVDYPYTAEAYTTYIYTFEAWTQSGTRDLTVQYYGDGETGQYLYAPVSITDTRETYRVVGETIPKDGIRALQFLCADQLGTFYVKIISIERATPAALWDKWVSEHSTATVDISVATDGVCTVTVGGTPTADSYNWWHTFAYYWYGAVGGVRYWYDFDAWTDGEEREIYVQYYNDGEEGIYLGKYFTITGQRKSYGFESDNNGYWLKGGNRHLEFQCANQTGTFYIKVNGIWRAD